MEDAVTGGSYAADPADYRPDATGYRPDATGYRPDATGYRADQPDYRPDVTDQSVGDLLGRVTSDLSTLMRQEVELAKVEIKEEATKAGKASGTLVGAGLVGYLVLVFLSLAVMFGLDQVLPIGWAAVITAVLLGIVAAVLFVLGRKQLQQVNPKPEQTVETLKEMSSGRRIAPAEAADRADQAGTRHGRGRADREGVTQARHGAPGRGNQERDRRPQGASHGYDVRRHVIGRRHGLGGRVERAGHGVRRHVGRAERRVLGRRHRRVDGAQGAPAGRGQSARRGADRLRHRLAGVLAAAGLAEERELAHQVKDQAQPAVQAVGQQAAQVLSEVKDNLQEPAQEAVQSVKDTATDAAGTVKDEARSAAGDVKGQAQDSTQRVRGQAPSSGVAPPFARVGSGSGPAR